MAGGDRISDLPDDLLQHILYFAPVKEAASTSALARRWRTQWLSSGAVNLDTRSYPGNMYQLYSKRPAFVRDADTALAARGRRWPLRKLTFRVEGHQPEIIHVFLCRGDDVDDIVDPVLTHPAVRPLEELCVDAYLNRNRWEYRHESGYYDLSVASLPSKNLRVLRISSCTNLKVPPAVAFPHLEELRLHFCSDVTLEGLQRVIDSAPKLAFLDLHSVRFSSEYDVPTADIDYYSPRPPVTLRCTSVTALVLSDCSWLDRYHRWTGVDLDAPMLRCFRYKGDFNWPVALKSQATSLTRLDINYYATGDQTCPSFWQCVESFSDAKVFKLKSSHIEHIAAVSGGETRTALFRNLERLELEAQYKPGESKVTGEAIGYLLHCCPVIRVLRLSLSFITASKTHSYRGDQYEPDVFAIKDRLDFSKSVDRFLSRRRLNKPMITYDYEVSDQIDGLSGESFTCLQSSLRSVSLRFPKEDSNCFGARLAKFFAENAMVLEEMYIDGGNQKLHEHMNHMVRRWTPGSASGFAVLPLERPKLAVTPQLQDYQD